MKRQPRDTSAVRREALKLLVPYAHWAAHLTTDDVQLARELRVLANRMDEMGSRGSPVVLAAFWGAAELMH